MKKIYMRGQINVVYKISLNFELQKIIKKIDKEKRIFLHGIVCSSEMYHLSEYGKLY